MKAAQQVPISQLRPADNNPREHGERQVELLAGGIRRFGFTMPVLIDESKQIIAGHGRVEAAKVAGLKSVPTLLADGWTDEQKREYLLLDNRLAEMSDWDAGMLREQLNDLRDAGENLDTLAFDGAALLKFCASEQVVEKPAPKKPPRRTKKSDVWQLGFHKLAVVNPRDRKATTDIFKRQAKLMVTRPTKPDTQRWTGFNGNVAYVWYDGALGGEYGEAMELAGFDIKYQIIWRSVGKGGNGNVQQVHQSALMGSRSTNNMNWKGGRKQTTIWKPQFSFTSDTEARRRCIINHLDATDAVYDPDDAAGDTLIAAEIEQRVAQVIVAKPQDADLVIDRWQNLTGEKAKRGR